MPSFSTFERTIARALKSSPAIKQSIKQSYQLFCYLVYGLGKKRCTSKYKIESINDYLPERLRGNEAFFGYYDKSPIRNNVVLTHCTESIKTSKTPSGKISVKILAVDITKQVKEPLFEIEAKAYNWQQGARTQWLSDDIFILNNYDEVKDKYISTAFSIKNRGVEKEFDYPIQDGYNTDYFLSINYSRLMSLRPDYGYRNDAPISEEQLLDLVNDGIWRVDYASGEAKLIYTLSEIANFKAEILPNSCHKANHLIISPDGTKFIFIHRYYIKKCRYDRLILADANGGKLTLLANNEMVSHCCWKDDNTVIGYLRADDGVDAYYEIDLTELSVIKLPNQLIQINGDGHPACVGGKLVVDTYPDKSRLQHLLMYNFKDNSLDKIASVYQSIIYSGETRCDLHPRLTPDRRYLFFDSVYTGKRELHFIQLESSIK